MQQQALNSNFEQEHTQEGQEVEQRDKRQGR